MLAFCLQTSAQSIIIGTGTDDSGGTGSDPIDGYYNAFRYQVVYTAAELGASLTPFDEITGLGWSISEDYAGGALQGYTIKMGHTSASNSSAHDASATIVVKNAFNYDPSATAAGVFDMIAFDTNFVWNGVDNVLVEVCSDGQNPFSSPYGQVRGTAGADGSRRYRVDSATACGVNTNNANAHKPNIQFNFIDGTPPACLAPSSLGAMNITAGTADLSWTENGTATAWDIEIVDITAMGTATGTPTVSGVSNPYTAMSLTDNNAYEYYVRADCGGSGTSTWAGPFAFTTACNAFAIPFTETFDSTSTSESCWTVLNENADADAWNTNYTADVISGDENAAIYTDFNAGNNDDWLISPTITLTGNERLRFKYSLQSTGEPNDFEVLLSTSGADTASFTNTILPLASYGDVDIDNGESTELTVDLSSYSGDVNIAWRVPPGGLDGWRLYIDDVVFETIPSCLAPSDLMASAISVSTADLSWTENGTATVWDIEIVDITAMGTATGTPTVSGVSNPYTAMSLTDNNAYEYYVRADCGGSGTSTWAGPFAFTTACNAFAIPFTETFDSTSTSESCWTVLNENADADAWNTNYTADVISGDENAAIYTDFNAGNNDDWLISPTITLTGNERLRFKYSLQSTGEPNDFEVLLSTSGADTASFTNTILPLASYGDVDIDNGESTELTVDLSSYSGDVNIAWRVPPGGLDGWRLYIDDVVVETIPSCLAPSDFMVSGISVSTADLSWTENGTATVWDIEVVDITAMETATGTPTVTGVANPYTLMGLSDQNEYEVYVRADCGGDTSTWVGPLNFSTLCNATSVPFSEDFETGGACGSIVNEGTGNSWQVVSATSYGFAPDHLRYSWNTSNPADTWFFTQGVNLTGGSDYTITYDYGGTGASFPEKLKVAYGTSASAAAMTTELADYPNVTNATPNSDSQTFTAPSSGVYYFGFQAYSDADQFYLHLDNIAVEVALSTSEFENQSAFTYYPNPVKNTLTLNAQNTIENVTMYNMLGQEVLSANPYSVDSDIDMSNLANGSYFVKVTIANITKTIRVIKQ